MTRVWHCPKCGSERTHCYDDRQYPEHHLVVCLDCGVASLGTWHPRWSSSYPSWHEHRALTAFQSILESEIGQEDGTLKHSNVLDRLGLDMDDFEAE